MNKKAILYLGISLILVGLLILAFIAVEEKINRKYDHLLKENRTNETDLPEEEYDHELSDRLGFVSNNVIVSFDDSLSQQEIISFIASRPEIIKADQMFENSYKLTLEKDFKSSKELNDYCRELERNEKLKYCEKNQIIKIDDCTKGPC